MKFKQLDRRAVALFLVNLIILAVGLLLNITEIRNLNSRSEIWTIISGIISINALVSVVMIYHNDCLDKKADRETNNQFVHLINFVRHYLSIEKSLYAAVLNLDTMCYTCPDTLNDKFQGNLSRDNLFTYLNMIYKLEHLINKCIETINNTPEKNIFMADYFGSRPTSSENIDALINEADLTPLEFAYCKNGKLYKKPPTHKTQEADNEWPLYTYGDAIDYQERAIRQYKYVVACATDRSNTVRPVYLVRYNFSAQIRERLSHSLEAIKIIDSACRKAIGYPEWKPD